MAESNHEGDKRGQIARAALGVFSRHGFHRATIQDIADEAGVGKGTVYLYFPSKDRLVEHTLRTVVEDYLAELRSALSGPEDVPARLRQLLISAVQAATSKQERARLLLEGSTGMSEEFKRWLLRLKQSALAEIAALVSLGVEQGQIREVDPMAVAHIVSGTLTSLVATALWAPEHLPAAETHGKGASCTNEAGAGGEMADKVFRLLWATLAPPEC